MKRFYSYFIIKPDGVRFLDEICDDIEQRYESVKYYAIEDFQDIIKKLYYKHYANKGEKFATSFDSYLYGLNEVFGNTGVMALVADTRMTYEELMKTVYETKLDLRNTYINNNVGIVTNYGNGEKNYIKMLSENNKETAPRIMNGLGNHRISDMNIIHCPDPNKEDTLSELNILIEQGIIDDKNMITREMMEKMKRYQTAKFQKDMREDKYEGETQPDISGFIKREIDEPFSRI